MQVQSYRSCLGYTCVSARCREIAAVSKLRRLFASIRYPEVLILQGPPLMGLVFSIGEPTAQKIAIATLCVIANLLLIAHIWALNDWADLNSDILDPNKQLDLFSRKGIDPTSMLWFAIALLCTSTALFACLPPSTFLM